MNTYKSRYYPVLQRLNQSLFPACIFPNLQTSASSE